MIKSNQLDSQIWRLYDDLEGTSILCESQEECEHLVTKFTEASKRTFTTDCQDFFPYFKDVHFTEDDIIAPMGYEHILYALITIDLTPWGIHAYQQRIAHYIYYHDYEEERRKPETKYKPEPLSGKYEPLSGKYTLNINGKVEIFTPYVDTDSWSKDDYPF